MSVELLEEDGVVHGPHHDLESVYWILVWIILRHTRHDSRATNKACGNLFKFDSDGDSADAKRSWLFGKGTIGVIDSAPLSWLIQEFTVLTYKHLSSRDGPGVSLTHDAVLKIFDQALKLTDRPEQDGAIAFQAPDLWTKDLPTNTTTASSKKRKEQPEDEELCSNATAASGSSKRTNTHACGSQPSTASSRGGKSSRGSSRRRGATRR